MAEQLRQRKVFIVRHGESILNNEKRHTGAVKNSTLTPQGEKDAVDVASWFLRRGIRVSRIISSPLERARLTGERIAEATNAPLEVREDAKELNLGDLEGMLISQARTDYSDFFTRRGRSAEAKVSTPYPNGESPEQALKRIKPLTDEILASGEEVIVIVGHQGVNRAIRSGLTGEPLESLIYYYQEHREVVEIDLPSKTALVRNIDISN
jgi:broad specificity phosphatase PhoE